MLHGNASIIRGLKSGKSAKSIIDLSASGRGAIIRQRILNVVNKLLTPDITELPVVYSDAIDSEDDITAHVMGQPTTLTFTAPLISPQVLPDEFQNLVGQTQTFSAPAILELKNATLLGRDSLVLTSQGKILLASLYNHAPYVNTVNYQRLNVSQSLQDMISAVMKAPEFERVASSVMLYSRGYFHWMMEQLPRLWLLRAYDPEVKLLIPPNPPLWMRESLILLELYENCIEWQSTNATAKTLIYPIPLYGTGIPAPRPLRDVSQYLQQQLSHDTPKFDTKRIYISRRSDVKRRVINEATLLPILDAYGFVSYDLYDLTFTEQIALFQQADIVVGAHGAGLVNTIHSQDIALLEFFEPSYLNACYYRLACGLGFNYGILMGTTQGQGMSIQPNDLDKALNQLISSRKKLSHQE